MNTHLATIQSLVDAYGSEDESRWFRALVKTYSRNPKKFWEEFGSVEVWGGAGSFIDQFMVSPAGRDMNVYLSDQRRFFSAMSALAREMAAAGYRSPRAEAWANAMGDLDANAL